MSRKKSHAARSIAMRDLVRWGFIGAQAARFSLRLKKGK